MRPTRTSFGVAEATEDLDSVVGDLQAGLGRFGLEHCNLSVAGHALIEHPEA